MPVGFYFRGIVFKNAWYNPKDVEVWRCVYPLYESVFGPHLNLGYPVSPTAATNYSWLTDDPRFAERLINVMESEVIPITAHIQTGADFLEYLNDNATRGGWKEWPKAQALIHMGELDQARDLLVPLAEIINKRFPDLKEPGIWGHNLIELLRLIDEDRDAIPAHCEAVAHHNIRKLKLDKFWDAPPFVYDATLSKR